MRKLRLDIDDLQVESFTVEAASATKGTVLGREVENQEPVYDGEWFPNGTMLGCTVNCSWNTCWVRYTCWPSCGGTCDPSCNGMSCVENECGA